MKGQPGFIRLALGLLLWGTAWWAVQCVVLHRVGLHWQLAAADAAAFSALTMISSAAAMVMYRFYQPGASNRFLRFGFALLITLITCALFEELMRFLYSSDEAYLVFLERSMPVRFVIAVLVIACVTLVNWIMNMAEEQRRSSQRRVESEQLVREAELLRLRQQLQPHFLFNSLNSISALAGSDPARARKMIEQLSDFLRGTLKKDDHAAVTLDEELAQLRLYLDIEKVRFSHRLKTDINIAEGCGTKMVPSLMLQPLVENAIKHGLYGTTGDITIAMKAWCDENALHVTVSNPFETTSPAGDGTGFGISSLRRRLFLLYARNDLLETKVEGNNFTTHLVIPQQQVPTAR